MACEWVKLNGMTMHIRHSGKRPMFCQFCRERPATKLCDANDGGRTCDASICDVCTTKGGKDIDFCPKHKHEAKQGGLFA